MPIGTEKTPPAPGASGAAPKHGEGEYLDELQAANLVTPSARAAAADHAAYDLAYAAATKKVELVGAIMRDALPDAPPPPAEGALVNYKGLALKISKVYPEDPGKVDLDNSYIGVPVRELRPLRPEKGWEEHKAEAEKPAPKPAEKPASTPPKPAHA